MTLLAPTPRMIPRKLESELRAQRRMGAALTASGSLLIVAFAVTKPIAVLVPHVWVVLIGGIASLVCANRKERLLLHGEERLAGVRTGRTLMLSYDVAGRRCEIGAGAAPLLYEEGLVRILVDPAKPSRAMPVTMEMIPMPPLSAAVDGIVPRLPATPRSGGPTLSTEARGRVAASGTLCVASMILAVVTQARATAREEFLAKAEAVGGRVVAIEGQRVVFEAGGLRGTTARGKSAPKVGTPMAAYRHSGGVRAERDLPGMPRAAAVLVSLAPLVAAAILWLVAVTEVREARRLWRDGVEVDARVVSRHEANGTVEIVYRFASCGRRGVGRREFAATRRPFTAADPFKVVVVVDARDEQRSRLVLADEV